MRTPFTQLLSGLLLTASLAGCANGMAERRAELTHWIGQPEAALLQEMGAPDRSYKTDSMTLLTYQDASVDVIPATPGWWGPGVGPYWGGGFPTQAITRMCDTTFTIVDGVVRGFSLRGNGCD